eukprot:CAMPEP_0118909314 /NCGR_PEP_ID=MMETSP1166-20130328/11948_1 /TAXON_ID=1104430 /ORGANISM="Chrysoreinhardia sp, Strain CCMP3193" /LENGTH=205 /DNA_ID=CAMNT_0006848735 /DNA_START=109 /DNA_END=722 /DNA_ORIENTATION=+
MDVKSALFEDSDESGDEEKAAVALSQTQPQVALSQTQPPVGAYVAPPQPAKPIIRIQQSVEPKAPQAPHGPQGLPAPARALPLPSQQGPPRPPPPSRRAPGDAHQPVRFAVSSQNGAMSSPGGGEQRPHRSSAQAQGDLTQLLKDVCALLGPEQRQRFRAFVQGLKKQRDAGQIDSLTRALLERGPRVVGQQVWQRAVEMQRRRG